MPDYALIVEDHPLYRNALIQLMRPIVGTAGTVAVSSAEEGLRRLVTLDSLGVILLDMRLPGVDGVDAIRAFQNLRPAIPIVVVSASEDRQEASRALRAGARVFISKAVSIEVLGAVIGRVLSGELSEPEWITASGQAALDNITGIKLTPRQRETLALLVKGYANKEICIRMGLAEITVKLHVSAVFRILGVVNRTQAVLAARRLGLALDEVPAQPEPG